MNNATSGATANVTADVTLDPNAAVDPHEHDTSGEATPLGVALFLLFVVVLLAALVYGAFAIGPWVIGVAALATVPVIYVVLLLLTTGR